MAQTSTKDEGRFERGGGRTPDDPTDLGKEDAKGILKRTWREFREDDLTDWAAALTYYGILSLFPGLLVLVSLLGLFGGNFVTTLIDNLAGVTPGPAAEIARNAVENIQNNSSTAGLAGLVGIAVALWSASNYVGAFTRASNSIYDIEEGRGFLKLKPMQIGITIVMVLMLSLCAIAVVVSGPLAKTIGDIVGLGDTAVTIWNIVKWPVIALVFMTLLAFLYYAAPNVKHPKFTWVSPGGVAAVVIWLIASALFAFYVANFGSYNKTYGTLGGVIIFLTWLWISNIAVLLGAELNAETERGRQIKKGVADESTEPFLEPRDTSKFKKAKEKAKARQRARG